MSLNQFGGVVQNYAEWLPRFWPGLGMTLWITAVSFAIAFAFGLFLEFMGSRKSVLLKNIAGGVMSVLRGVPLLVILYLLYFALPEMGVTLSSFQAGAIGLGLVHGAYLAEIFRAGKRTLNDGQREAALAAGFSPAQSFRLIEFPQIFKAVLPPLLVSLISLMKDSSICALIALNEITLTSRAIMAETFLPLQVFILAGLLYFVIAWPASLFVKWLEKRLSRRNPKAVERRGADRTSAINA